MLLDEGIRKLILEEANAAYENNKGHAAEVFLTRMEGVGTICIGGPLHIHVPFRASRKWRPVQLTNKRVAFYTSQIGNPAYASWSITVQR